MANTYTTAPLVINTVIATSVKAAMRTALSLGAGTQFTLKIVGIIWESPATIADTFVITDPVSGKTLWTGTCEVALQSQYFNWTAKPRIWADLAIPTLASGTLYIDYTM